MASLGKQVGGMIFLQFYGKMMQVYFSDRDADGTCPKTSPRPRRVVF